MAWRIVFVCTGNICRSPTAEGVLRQMAAAQGQAGRVEAASAGLQDWHAGAPPDVRSQAHAQRRGHDLATLRAKHFTRLDFERFDWVIAMDAGHHDQLRRLCPPQQAHKLRLAADFSDRIPAGGVPDPYYGGASGFEAVLDLIESICAGVLAEVGRLRVEHALPKNGSHHRLLDQYGHMPASIKVRQRSHHSFGQQPPRQRFSSTTHRRHSPGRNPQFIEPGVALRT